MNVQGQYVIIWIPFIFAKSWMKGSNKWVVKLLKFLIIFPCMRLLKAWHEENLKKASKIGVQYPSLLGNWEDHLG